MKDLLDKLSSYNLFNYLLPGTIFVALARVISDHTFKQDNIVLEVFVYYFVGLVISRIGSLIVGPLMRTTRFIKFADYTDFVRACKQDEKIELLSEQNNSYRTLCAVFVSLGLLRLYDLTGLPRGVVLIGLFGLFALAYRKQTGFVRKRVEIATARQSPAGPITPS